jgi:hypothetical protein
LLLSTDCVRIVSLGLASHHCNGQSFYSFLKLYYQPPLENNFREIVDLGELANYNTKGDYMVINCLPRSSFLPYVHMTHTK